MTHSLRASAFQREQSRLGSIQIVEEGQQDSGIVGEIMQRPIIGHLVPKAGNGLTQIIDLMAGISNRPFVLPDGCFERSRFHEQRIGCLMLTATELPRRTLEQLPDARMC